MRSRPDRSLQPVQLRRRGSARVPLWTFIWTTAIGYIPITALFVLLGSRLEELSLTVTRFFGANAWC